MNNIKIIPLGGMGEVGKNCYVIEYDNFIYIIDFGVLFAKESQLGVDYVIPNFSYLKENQHKIRGLYITHGHEDHIGGIPFLLKNLKIDTIYAPTIAALMIEKRLKEHKLTQKIIQVNEDTIFDFPNFRLSYFRQTHSIPDSLGIFIETPDGNIIHSGDFKIDFSPPGQQPPNFQKMIEISQKNILCMLSDSTNSEVPGFSLSEKQVGDNIHSVVKAAKGRIILSTFASNMNRVQMMIESCIKNDRYIAIVGKSLDNGVKIGSRIGYINTKNKLIKIRDIDNYPEKNIAIICTGSQGEPFAALSRIAQGLHPATSFNSEDTIVFASNPIPGNNFQVGCLIDHLSKSGATIIRNSNINQIHASGHASQEEQKLLISLFKPKSFMPIHGTFNMLLSHSQSAQQLNISKNNNYLLNNGDALYLNKNKDAKIIRKETDGRSMFVGGSNISIFENNYHHLEISKNGVLFLSLVYCPSKNKIVSNPLITTRGFVYVNDSIQLIRSLRYEFLNYFKKYIDDNKFIESEINDRLIKHISEFLKRKGYTIPYITVTILIHESTKFENNSHEKAL